MGGLQWIPLAPVLWLALLHLPADQQKWIRLALAAAHMLLLAACAHGCFPRLTVLLLLSAGQRGGHERRGRHVCNAYMLAAAACTHGLVSYIYICAPARR